MTHELSPWIMFLHADFVVKAVMIGLMLASVATWTVLLAKTVELRAMGRRIRAGLAVLADTATLHDAQRLLDETHGPVTRLAAAAAVELRLSSGMPANSVKERTASRLDGELIQLGRALGKGTGILATIGSTGPFIGLFGTVWGIMNSFIGIAKSQTTNLAVVAPGIAEALLATGMGLVAAIPAVIVYNAFARTITGLRAEASDAAAEVLRLVGRDLDREVHAFHRAAAE